MRKRAVLEERRDKILQIAQREQYLHVRKLSEMFGVSTETIRKDLIYLEQQGAIHKNYGGATLEKAAPERAIEPRMREHVEQKARIAQRAMQLLPDKGVLILDAGSTLFQLAKLLASSDLSYTVITNSISIANLLAGGRHVVLCVGGELRGTTMSMTGMWSVNALSSIKADLAILGTSGFLLHDGPCSEAFVEVDVKRAILQSSRRHIVLSDSSKFNTGALVSYASWQEIDLLITDENAPADKLEKLQRITEVELVSYDVK